MAWTADRWPLVGCDPVDTRYANELRTELNARTGAATIADAFVDGEFTWQVVAELRAAVEGVLTDFYDGDATLKQFAANDAAGAGTGFSATISIFDKLFGSGRLTWRNELDGTEAAGPGYDPTVCIDPYIFHLNELYGVIDALKWLAVDTVVYTGDSASKSGLRKRGGAWNEATKQDALDAAWAVYLAYVADASNWTAAGSGLPYTEWGGLHTCDKMNSIRVFRQATIPAAVLACKAVMAGISNNHYYTAVGDVKTPQWYAGINVGTASPGNLGNADWSYGALGASPAVPDVVVVSPASTTTLFGAALTNYTANALNYFQVRHKADDTTKPQFCVDSGLWHEADQNMERELTAGLRVLYRFVA